MIVQGPKTDFPRGKLQARVGVHSQEISLSTICFVFLKRFVRLPVMGDSRSWMLVGTLGVRNGPATVGRMTDTRWRPFSRANLNAASSVSRLDRM